eukprot:4960897-Prymnesium_polylepis.2
MWVARGCAGAVAASRTMGPHVRLAVGAQWRPQSPGALEARVDTSYVLTFHPRRVARGQGTTAQHSRQM